MGLAVSGVDLIRSERGPLVLEVNSSPGLEGIETTTGVDVAGEIVEYIENNVAERFTDSAVEVGVAGTRRVLHELGMIEEAPEPSGPVSEARDSQWVRASRSGICRIETPLGAQVRKGQRLGGIFELLGEKETRVRAGIDGVVIGRRANPLVHKGEAVVHLARLG